MWRRHSKAKVRDGTALYTPIGTNAVSGRTAE